MDPPRAIHRCDDATSNDDARETRCQERWNADGDSVPRRLEHGRLRQSRRRDARRFARWAALDLPLRQQEGRRLRGLYEHDPGRRLPRLWHLANDVCDRMRDGRARQTAGSGAVRDSPQEYGSTDRRGRVGLERPDRRRIRKLRSRSELYRYGGKSARERARGFRSPRERTELGGNRVCDDDAGKAVHRPSTVRVRTSAS